MCEIFFVKNTEDDKVSEEGLKEITEAAIDAGDSNDDGWGVFNENGRYYKTDDQYDEEAAKSIQEEFKDSKFVVIHLRLASQGGVSESNAHPFVKTTEEGFEALVHNGNLYFGDEDDDEDITDSEILLRKINKQDEETTEERIKEVMSNCRGSASVMFYDKNNNLYYFRRRSDFSFMKVSEKNEIYGATKEKRLKDMYAEDTDGFFNEDKYYKTVREVPTRTIYKIVGGSIEEVEDIPLRGRGVSSGINYSYHGFSGEKYNGKSSGKKKGSVKGKSGRRSKGKSKNEESGDGKTHGDEKRFQKKINGEEKEDEEEISTKVNRQILDIEDDFRDWINIMEGGKDEVDPDNEDGLIKKYLPSW